MQTQIAQDGNMVELPQFDLHWLPEVVKTNARLFGGTPPSDEAIEQGVSEYLQFMRKHRMAGTPDEFVEKPSDLADMVFHCHLTESEQYRKDCESYFGKMVEHSNAICEHGGAKD